MAGSFFFYDLETTGINAREARIMQFAGQRTDMDLKPIGEPVNLLIKLTPDVVPEPDAIMITGITPQSTLADGVTESEFLKIFYDEVVQDGTIFLGFNSVRFDDEFMRFLHYRNFYDAYEWQWCDDCSRWDILDVVRMTRALRPEGIDWPFTSDGKPTNRLELLTALNGLDHEHAHDALSDVYATIAVAKLIHDKQPGLFDYLLEARSKNKVKQLVEQDEPFVYTCGRYPSATLHTSVVVRIGEAPYGAAYVYDLRYDPVQFMDMSDVELVDCCRYSPDRDKLRLPVKQLKYNHCPAVAPTGVIKDAAVQKRLELDLTAVAANLRKLKSQPQFTARIIRAYETIENDRQTEKPQQADMFGHAQAVDGQLYDGFIPKPDCATMKTIRGAEPKAFGDLQPEFQDKRLQALLPLYKARNYPKLLSSDERQAWDEFCKQRLVGGGQNSRLAKYFKRIDELAQRDSLTQDQQYSLEELHLYGESIMPMLDDPDAAAP